MPITLRGALVASPFLLSALPAAAQQGEPSYYGPHMWDSGWHGWFLGPVMMVLLLVVAVAVVLVLVRWLGPGHASGHHGAPNQAPSQSPMDILKERFARGEIDKEEYEERRRLLKD